MSGSRRRRIAVLLDHIESDYPVEVLQGVIRAARPSRARTLVIPGGWLEPSKEEPVVRNFIYDLLVAAEIDGLLIFAGSLSNFVGIKRLREWVTRFAGTPSVFVGLELHGLPSVYVDNEVGVRAAVGHLIDKHQRRRIAFLSGPEESPECEARKRGYLAALEDHQIAFDQRLLLPGMLGREFGVAAVQELFDERRFTPATLDAIVGCNDDVALGALEELTRRGIGVPSPIAVIGFDDAKSAALANPPLTTIAQRVELQAYTAGRLLLDHLEHGRPMVSMALESELVLRSSCGCSTRFRNDSRSVRPPKGGMARTCRLALIERRSHILAELSRSGAGRLVGMTGWESRLFDALAQDLATTDGSVFIDEVEDLVRRNVTLGHDLMVCHDVLTTLRLQALACAALEPPSRPRVEDIFQESRLATARIGVDVERAHQRMLNQHMRIISRVCIGALGTRDAAALPELLAEHLPALGIRGFSVTRLLGSAESGTQLKQLARRSESVTTARELLSASTLGLDSTLEQEDVMVIEPLEFAGKPIGLAALGWGARDPLHYEQLRELLSAAVYADVVGTSVSQDRDGPRRSW
jgi:DNA-binding LacI/PurR family transcriptional regulator